MIEYHCQQCGKTRSLRNVRKRVFCGCGGIAHNPNWVNSQLQSNANAIPCANRGLPIASEGCGCDSRSTIHECKIYGKCNTSSQQSTKTTEQSCIGCRDRIVYPKGRIGFALQVFNNIGGMETWARTLIDHVYQDKVSGIFTPQNHYGQVSCTIANSQDGLHQVAEASDIVLVWGEIPNLELVVRQYPKKRFIAVHHGSLASVWAQSIFPRQLEVCGEGIAIDPEVASHFQITYLPNPSVDHGIRRKVSLRDGKKKVLWNHRWSDEKRPKLALDIAKHLPSDYKFYVSAPKNVHIPDNCIRIVQEPSNFKLLSEMDIFLSTSSQESFGYSLAEAVHARVPVVCSPYGIGKHIATKIVDSDDPQQWIEAILQVDEQNIEVAHQYVESHHGKAAILAWQKLLAGPGTELLAITSELGISSKPNCSCKATAAKMDAWRIDGCEQNRDWIVQQLEANAAKWSWLEKLQIAASNAVNPLALSIAFRGNIYHALLDEAIQRSRLASKIV